MVANKFDLILSLIFIPAIVALVRFKLVSDVEIIRVKQGDVDISTTMSVIADL